MQRPGIGASAVLRLVRARLLGRRSAAALVALAVAGAIVVVGSLFGVAAVTADLATQQAMADLHPRDRAIQVNRYSDGAVDEARADETVRAALRTLASNTQPIVAAVIIQPGFSSVPTPPAIGLDGLADWVVVKDGRLPQPCDGGAVCEGFVVSLFESDERPNPLGTTGQVGAMAITTVGVGTLRPELPLEFLPFGEIVFVDGAAALAAAPLLADEARTRFWIAPLDPARTHAWSLDGLKERIDEVERALAADDSSFTVQSPDVTFGQIKERTATAAGRLVFIGSFVVAVLLAFAVFAAAVERDDVGQEYRRLRTHGATLAQRLLFVAAEAAIPSLLGALAGWLAAAGVVGTIGLSQGATVLEILGVSLLEPVSLAIIGAIALLAAVAVFLGIHPESGRLIRPRSIALAVVPVAAVLVWDRVSRGQVNAAELAEQTAGPGTVLLPGLLGLSVILGSLVVVPPIVRRLARVARRAPLGLRLAVISIAREPLRPTATMTLLAFSLGAAVFALSYGSTLRQGAADSAAFSAGMDLRVRIGGPGDFIDGLGFVLAQEPAINVQLHRLHGEGARTASGRQVALIGIEPDAIPLLRGWRSDFSDSSPAELAAAIARPGDWRLVGRDLPTGARDVAVDVDAAGDTIQLTAIVERDDGGFETLPLGDVAAGRHVMHTELFPSDFEFSADYPSGWRLVAIFATNGGPAAAIGPRAGEPQQADIRFFGLDPLFADGASLHIDVSGSHRAQILRPPEPTDGAVLPAIVSPELAEDVDERGILIVEAGDGIDVAVRPVATARLFPTMTEPGKNLVIVDRAPLSTLLNADAPGRGLTTDMLVRTDDLAVVRAVAARLERFGFPRTGIVVRADLEAAQALDPFALGVAWSLAVGAIAGIGLSAAGILLALRSRLQDDRGDLGELEEQGLAPAALARLAVLQTLLVAAVGIAVGAMLGLGLGWLTAASIAVGGSGALPVPPLRVVAPWAAIGLVIAVVLAGLTLSATIVSRRHFSGSLPGEKAR